MPFYYTVAYNISCGLKSRTKKTCEGLKSVFKCLWMYFLCWELFIGSLSPLCCKLKHWPHYFDIPLCCTALLFCFELSLTLMYFSLHYLLWSSCVWLGTTAELTVYHKFHFQWNEMHWIHNIHEHDFEINQSFWFFAAGHETLLKAPLQQIQHAWWQIWILGRKTGSTFGK